MKRVTYLQVDGTEIYKACSYAKLDSVHLVSSTFLYLSLYHNRYSVTLLSPEKVHISRFVAKEPLY